MKDDNQQTGVAPDNTPNTISNNPETVVSQSAVTATSPAKNSKKALVLYLSLGAGLLIVAAALITFFVIMPMQDKKDQTPASTNNSAQDSSEKTSSNGGFSPGLCYTGSDYDKFNDVDLKRTEADKARIIEVIAYESFFFKPDSEEYEFEAVTKDSIQEFKDLYLKAQGLKKAQPKIVIQGAVKSDQVTDLANTRAEKVKQALVDAGVKSSDITIAAPKSDNAEGSIDDTTHLRSVTLNMKVTDPSCKSI